METDFLILLTLIACLGLSFLFSGMEAGVFALSRVRIRQQMRAGKRSARLLHGYLEDPEKFLWTILVGNTVANFIALGLIVAGLHQRLYAHPAWFVLVFLLIVFLLYAFADLLPKMLFRLFPNRLCLLLVRPFRFIHLGLSPLVALLEWSSRWLLRWTGGKVFTGHMFGNRDELRLVMQESAQGFTSEERLMINRVLDLQNLTVRQIAIPLTQAVTVTLRTPMGEVLTLCRERHLTRLPVWESPAEPGRIAGLVSLKEQLYRPDLDPGKTVAEFVKPALYLDEALRLEVALRRMQRSGQRLAIVLGRDKRELGIVSLQDILKVIFGEVSL
jgi:CBS domain containing-hemolysin-like protein